MGYDVSDYRAIEPKYGNMDDMDDLLSGLHSRGMKFVMDLVVNHTSDQHEWFQESRSSKDSPKRDWYIWHPSPGVDENGIRLRPNNWGAVFREENGAWEWDEKTQEFYLHLYCVEQPDLNWDNREVRQAVYDLMIFWLEKGVDGFRMDVINLISKAPGMPDATVIEPNERFQPPYQHVANGPRVHEYIKEMNREVLSSAYLLSSQVD